MRIDLHRLFSMVPREAELESLFGPLAAEELYEIHITVKSDGEIEEFKACCAELEVKPLVVQLANGSVPDDVMTSSSIKCAPSELRDECMRILIGLEAMGWRTIRCKVETPPFHSKVVGLKPEEVLPSQYFEAHIPVQVSKCDDVGALRVLSRCFDMHLSANAFKIEDEVRTLMVTYRSSEFTPDAFRYEVDLRVGAIREALYHVKDVPVVEFAIFDSNREHDREWLSSKLIELDRSTISQMVAERMANVEKSLNLA